MEKKAHCQKWWRNGWKGGEIAVANKMIFNWILRGSQNGPSHQAFCRNYIIFSEFRLSGRNLDEVVPHRARFSEKNLLSQNFGKWTSKSQKQGFFNLWKDLAITFY